MRQSYRHRPGGQQSLESPKVNEPLTRFNYLAAHAAALRDPDREARVRALRGKYASLIPTTDEYLREKHEELRQEEATRTPRVREGTDGIPR